MRDARCEIINLKIAGAQITMQVFFSMFFSYIVQLETRIEYPASRIELMQVRLCLCGKDILKIDNAPAVRGVLQTGI